MAIIHFFVFIKKKVKSKDCNVVADYQWLEFNVVKSSILRVNLRNRETQMEGHCIEAQQTLCYYNPKVKDIKGTKGLFLLCEREYPLPWIQQYY